jgi:aspartate aminotransferase
VAPRLSARAQRLAPSPTLALNARVRALRAKGVDVVGFGVGEPDFDTPAHIKRAAIEALQEGFTKYTDTGGIPELRAAVVAKLSAERGQTYAPDEILVSCGAKHCLFNFFQAVLEEGDEVVIPSPYWVSYPDMVSVAGGRPVFAAAEERDAFRLRPDVLARAFGAKTRALVLNSPCNPTGAVLPEARLREIAELLRQHPNVWVVTDDIYERLIYTGEPFRNLLSVAPDLRERTLVVSGVSKTYSMTGWRIGYAAGPRELVQVMKRIQDQSTSNATSFAQRGALAALEGPNDGPELMRQEFDRRRRRMMSLLREIPGITCAEPEGAFYTFPGVHSLLPQLEEATSSRFCDLLLDRGVAAVPGECFGAPGHIRLSFAVALPELEKGLARLAAFAEELRGPAMMPPARRS